jgi:hypothetical protein
MTQFSSNRKVILAPSTSWSGCVPVLFTHSSLKIKKKKGTKNGDTTGDDAYQQIGWYEVGLKNKINKYYAQ